MNTDINERMYPHRADVFRVMEKILCHEKDVIIRQGDKGDKFYCVATGDFMVLVRSNGTDGSLKEDMVHQYDGRTHPSFGELALMHGNPRSSSVIAITEGRLFIV